MPVAIQDGLNKAVLRAKVIVQCGGIDLGISQNFAEDSPLISMFCHKDLCGIHDG